jgi:hypothetical protein
MVANRREVAIAIVRIVNPIEIGVDIIKVNIAVDKIADINIVIIYK